MKEQIESFSEKSEKSKRFCCENLTEVKAATPRTSLAAWRADSAAHFVSWLINRVNMHSSNPSAGLFLMKLIFQINEFPRVWMSCIYSYSCFHATEHGSSFQAHYTIFGACLFCQDVERRTCHRRRCFCLSSAACQASHYLLLRPATLTLEFDNSKRRGSASKQSPTSSASRLRASYSSAAVECAGAFLQNLCTFCLNCIVSLKRSRSAHRPSTWGSCEVGNEKTLIPIHMRTKDYGLAKVISPPRTHGRTHNVQNSLLVC